MYQPEEILMDEQERRRLLLAYAIATYHSTLTSMEALMKAGVEVGFPTFGGVRRKLHGFAHEWDLMHHERFVWSEARLPLIVDEARAFCTEHQQDVDELERGLTPTTERK